MGLPNSKQLKENNKSYQRLKYAVNDPLIPGKFRFFAEIAVALIKFIVLYQAEKSMVPFITQSLEGIIHSFGSTLILAEKVKAAKTCFSLFKINLKEPSYHKKNTEIPIKIELSDQQKSGKISDTLFSSSSLMWFPFISAFIVHLVERSPIKYYLSRNT